MIDAWRQSVKRSDRTFEIEIIGDVQVENIPKEVNCKNRTFFFVVAFVRQRFVLLNAEIAA